MDGFGVEGYWNKISGTTLRMNFNKKKTLGF